FIFKLFLVKLSNGASLIIITMSEEQSRLEKLNNIKEQGINPYISTCRRTRTINEMCDNFDDLLKKGDKISLVGRLRLMRGHGKASFADLEDGTGRMQIYLKHDIVGAETYTFFVDDIDVGDFIEVEGTLFLTKTNEKTLVVEKLKLLSKALLPLPEKWHGLSDPELKSRKRYLDLLANPEVKNVFITRSRLIKLIRRFFDERDYLEVETPILQPMAGGAAAKPFATHHNALDIDMYLRIAPELYLKRLIVGGFEKVYEVAKCFRNEGIDWAHNPEFTQIEFYQAYADYRDLMRLTEELMSFLVQELTGGEELIYGDHHLSFKTPFSKIDYRQALIKYANIDLADYPEATDLAEKAIKMGLKIEKAWGKGKLIDEIYKELVRPKLIDPVFIINHPIELSPLAKKIENNPKYVERFQLVIAGAEFCNAYSELNDPLDQESRFKEQQELLAKGDEEAQSADNDFVEALKYGMPPTAGEGIGIDRLLMLFTNIHNIKEGILFPTMRPKA
ncbi:MAG: lysine--tRNA ligase, partial [Patescibacteria group bacterium]